MQLSDRTGLTALRVLVATQLVIHGSYRTLAGGVVPFGGWLAEQGVPFGPLAAGLLTAIEVLGGLALMSGRLVRPLAAWFALQLLLGIVMVHWPEGWFVVGGGRNGMEYSVVLIGGLGIVGLTAPPAPRPRGSGGA
ncbi:MAG: DoxX family protein [Gemmatimonadetes bacterium]|jgi:putative oxidoreductase|nr:DoxX family protein [Gemmatimonadota bacterium]MBP6669075.1 DoxX family protein [Gemmatimonadales bacterium]MBK6781856.1 DoxX family protein [Gemmatimonadota bacterium]MBK7352065.1 DoxX family protein [Gemmatimonadota bacterium]MBK7717242.1 DoxX family protein [Gemmatimonadota bacterium]